MIKNYVYWERKLMLAKDRLFKKRYKFYKWLEKEEKKLNEISEKIKG